MTARFEFYCKGRPRLARPYHLKGIGLPNVYLHNGVEIENGTDYGRLVTIANLPELLRAIGGSVVVKHDALTGDEMRYLRKQMQLIQAALAKQLRVNQQTVANYEKVKTEAGAADFAIRALYLAHTATSEAMADLMREIAASVIDNDSRQIKRKSRKNTGPWHLVEHRAA